MAQVDMGTLRLFAREDFKEIGVPIGPAVKIMHKLEKGIPRTSAARPVPLPPAPPSTATGLRFEQMKLLSTPTAPPPPAAASQDEASARPATPPRSSAPALSSSPTFTPPRPPQWLQPRGAPAKPAASPHPVQPVGSSAAAAQPEKLDAARREKERAARLSNPYWLALEQQDVLAAKNNIHPTLTRTPRTQHPPAPQVKAPELAPKRVVQDRDYTQR